MIQDEPHRMLEVEFYHQGEEHIDPFAHGEELQRTCERWYFHRDSGSYRGGSFKGLDATFGPEGDVGGILIRTIQRMSDGEVINGCSLCVDHMLATTGEESVADLDAAIEERDIWDEESPIHIARDDGLEEKEIIATARVGLTLKRMGSYPDMPEYLMRAYRFLTDAKIKKGKLYTIVALLERGLDTDAIRALTNSPRKSIDKYRDLYEEGKKLDSFSRWEGKKLKSSDLALLHGACANVYGE
ncbi:unnamed protein product [Laminaria digitata]